MGTDARLESSSSQVCHLLSIPGLGGESFGEIGGETIDETILHWGFLYFSVSTGISTNVSTGRADTSRSFVGSKTAL